jgi:hypothetical protein
MLRLNNRKYFHKCTAAGWISPYASCQASAEVSIAQVAGVSLDHFHVCCPKSLYDEAAGNFAQLSPYPSYAEPSLILVQPVDPNRCHESR